MTAGRVRLGAVGVLALGVLAVVAVLAAAGAAGDNIVLADAGPVVRTAGPIAAMVADLAAAVALGGAVIGGWLLRADADRTRAMGIVAVAAGIATIARLLGLLTSYALATGQSLTSDRFGSDLPVFVATDLGTWLLTALVLLAGSTTAALVGTSRTHARAVAILLGAAACATAMTGHAAGGSSHETATSTLAVHLLGVGVWVGGLLVLQVLPSAQRDDAAVLRGFSRLALVAWIAVGLSGLWALGVRMTAPADVLSSPYVQLGVVKALLLLTLAVLGYAQRQQLAARVDPDAPVEHAITAYRRLAVMELLLMGLAIALAAAMSSSPPPAVEVPPPVDAASRLSGYPLPPEPTLFAVLSQWRPDPAGLAAAAAVLLWFWRPAAPRRRRADVLAAVGGVALLVLVTSGPLAVYSKVLVSAHIVLHALLLAVGLLLGAAVQRSTWLRDLLPTRPLLAAALAAAGPLLLIGVYAQPFTLRLALTSHAAHLMLMLLAVVVGELTAQAVRCARSPWPGLAAAAAVLLAAAITLAVGDRLLAASWFGATGRPWLADALADQRTGGMALVGGTVLVAAAAAIAIRRTGRGPSADDPAAAPGP